MSEPTCFHCGEPCLVGGIRWVGVIPVCCAGCEAAYHLIHGAGLDAYYRLRTENAPKAEDPRRDEWVAYDRDAVQRGLVACIAEDNHEVVLLLDGLRCAACSWLVEHALARHDGVRETRLNAATSRLLLRWNPRRTTLSALLGELAALGYTPHPLDAAGQDRALVEERRKLLKRLWVAGLGMMQVMMYAIAVYVGEGRDLDASTRDLFNWVSLLITTPVVFYSAAPFFSGAWRGIVNRAPGMDLPVALAIALAYAASVTVTFQGGAAVYFDSVTMFTFFLLAGRWFEMGARHRAVRMGDAMGRLVPDTAERIGTEPGRVHRDAPTFVGAVELQPGDLVRVRAGDRFPSDGRLTHGDTHVDESLLTGESTPLPRSIGDTVIAGSVNLDAPVELEVDRAGTDTVASGIARLLARAQGQRPRIALSADRVARWFVVVVLGLAALTFTAWLQLDPARAFPVTLAVLVVACPCALALATPVALTNGTLALARRGLLVTRPDALELLARADVVVFDKTGTLTHGDMRIAQVSRYRDFPEQEVLAISAALERAAEHPIAAAFRDYDDGRDVSDLKVLRHRGVEGTIDGIRYSLGQNTDDHEHGDAPTLLADESGPIAGFEFSDTVRPGAKALVERLLADGIEVEILSGDSEAAVRAVAAELGVARWHARQSPEQKLERVQTLQRRSGPMAAPTTRGREWVALRRTVGFRDESVERTGMYSQRVREANTPTGRERHRGHENTPTQIVAVVGDGVNDAPVLAGADVAVAVGSGAALAQSSAGLILLGPSPAPLGHGIVLARRTLRVIRQNLALSLFYNLGSIPLAAAGLVPPWLAALGMAGSSFIVVLNSVKLHE